METYYHIISKTECINNIVQQTNIGYTDSLQDASIINANYEITLGNWIRMNKALLETGITNMYSYFMPNQKVYNAQSKATCIDGLGLTLITDINTLV
jgi:hypothetical protein